MKLQQNAECWRVQPVYCTHTDGRPRRRTRKPTGTLDTIIGSVVKKLRQIAQQGTCSSLCLPTTQTAPGGVQLTMWTYFGKLWRIRNLAYTIWKIVRWWLPLFELELPVVCRTGIKIQTTDAMSHFTASGTDNSLLIDETPEITITAYFSVKGNVDVSDRNATYCLFESGFTIHCDLIWQSRRHCRHKIAVWNKSWTNCQSWSNYSMSMQQIDKITKHWKQWEILNRWLIWTETDYESTKRQ